jgi:hypothetical protein
MAEDALPLLWGTPPTPASFTENTNPHTKSSRRAGSSFGDFGTPSGVYSFLGIPTAAADPKQSSIAVSPHDLIIDLDQDDLGNRDNVMLAPGNARAG